MENDDYSYGYAYANASDAASLRHAERQYVGYMADLIERLSELVGFDYDIRPAPDGSFGYQRRDGTWDGIMGELVNKVGTASGGTARGTASWASW